MLKCPFCQFDNEDGALFCEQCKSDLVTVAATPAAKPAMAEPVPMAAIVEEPIPLVPLAEPVMAAPVPMAMPEPIALASKEPTPVAAVQVAPAVPMAEALELSPVVAAPVAETPLVAAAPPVVEPAAPAAETAPAAPAAAEAAPGKLPEDAKPKLIVIRGMKINEEFPIYPDLNFIGRSDEKAVDIDLTLQEPEDRVWVSRQHALITFEDGALMLEDLNSTNGTFVNRARVYPGTKRQLNVNDVIQIGTVQFKVKL